VAAAAPGGKTSTAKSAAAVPQEDKARAEQERIVKDLDALLEKLAREEKAKAEKERVVERLNELLEKLAREQKDKAQKDKEERDRLLRENRALQAELERARATAEVARVQAQLLSLELAKRKGDQIEGVLTRLDVEKSTVSVTLGATTLKVEAIPLRKDVKFFLGGKECSIDDLKPGMKAILQLAKEKDQTVIAAVKAEKLAKKE
jgi:hypothetical protein